MTQTARGVGSGPVSANVELKCEQFDRSVRSELADNRVGANEGTGRDQHSVVAATGNQRWQIFEAGREPLDDVEKLERLKVGSRGLAIRPPLAAKFFAEPRVGIEPTTYALRGGSGPSAW
jgi:hypothetical protein